MLYLKIRKDGEEDYTKLPYIPTNFETSYRNQRKGKRAWLSSQFLWLWLNNPSKLKDLNSFDADVARSRLINYSTVPFINAGGSYALYCFFKKVINIFDFEFIFGKNVRKKGSWINMGVCSLFFCITNMISFNHFQNDDLLFRTALKYHSICSNKGWESPNCNELLEPINQTLYEITETEIE